MMATAMAIESAREKIANRRRENILEVESGNASTVKYLRSSALQNFTCRRVPGFAFSGFSLAFVITNKSSNR